MYDSAPSAIPVASRASLRAESFRAAQRLEV